MTWVTIKILMPTTDHEDDEIEEMYEQIERIINKQKGKRNALVLGDFNATVGEGSDEKLIGNSGDFSTPQPLQLWGSADSCRGAQRMQGRIMRWFKKCLV